jgi:type I restriction enzyme R subunit
MALGSEKAAVQNPLIRYAVEVGWTYLSPEAALDRRRGITSPVLDSVLVEQLQRLNPGLVDSLRALELTHRIARVRPTIEGNFDAWQYLKGLKTVFVPEEKRERNVRLLDLDAPPRNAFHVTDELLFSNGTPPDIRTDVTFFINGLPVVVVETKAATDLEGLAEALDDLRYYHEKGPELLALVQLQALTHLVAFHYGATWNFSRKGLFQWRDEQAVDFETVVKTFTAPDRVLRLLTDYVLFVRRNDELTKTVLRPHQMRAAERCLARALDPIRRRGLVWHTQGSGKTYTMIVVARLLMADPGLDNPTVLLLIDRTELETQLSGVLESVGLGQGTIARSKRHLRRLLAADQRGLIVSMIHKFDDVPPSVNLSPNIFILVDEAHRTTEGDLGNYLMGAPPQRHLPRLHRHADRPHGPRQGHLQGLWHGRRQGLPRQVFDPRVPGRRGHGAAQLRPGPQRPAGGPRHPRSGVPESGRARGRGRH